MCLGGATVIFTHSMGSASSLVRLVFTLFEAQTIRFRLDEITGAIPDLESLSKDKSSECTAFKVHVCSSFRALDLFAEGITSTFSAF